MSVWPLRSFQGCIGLTLISDIIQHASLFCPSGEGEEGSNLSVRHTVSNCPEVAKKEQSHGTTV